MRTKLSKLDTQIEKIKQKSKQTHLEEKRQRKKKEEKKKRIQKKVK